MTWLRPSSFAASCRQLVAVAGLAAAGVLLSTGSAQADEAGEGSVLGILSETVEVVPVDDFLEDTAEVVTPAVDGSSQQVADVTEAVIAPVEVVTETVVEPVTEPLVAPVEAATETVVQPVVELADPVVEVVEPVVAPAVETLTPVVEPLAPVVEPVTTAVEPVADITEDVEPIDVRDEIVAPVEHAPASPATQPLADDPDTDDIDSQRLTTVSETLVHGVELALDDHTVALKPVVADRDAPAPLLELPASMTREAPSAPNSAAKQGPPAAPTSPDSPAQTGTCAPTGSGTTARSGLDSWAHDLTWFGDVRKGDVVERTDSPGPRDPYRDIPTSPA